jgi:uncharacterized membrane protein
MESPAAPLPTTGTKFGQVLSSTLQVVFHLGYPLIVYLAYTRLETRSLALLLLGLYALTAIWRFRGSREEIWKLLRQHAGLGVLIGVAVATGNRTVLLLLPVVVNLYLLWTFSSSLRDGPPMIERFARMVEDDLPDFTLPYCRKVTICWCAFLIFNAGMLVVLAVAAPVSWWALYTGLISYVLIGVMVAGEFVLRKLWFRHYGAGVADRILARVFPPQRTHNGRRSLAYVAQREANAS